MRASVLILGIGIPLLLMPSAGYADRKGQGGVVIEDDVPVYKSADSQEVMALLKRGHPVAAKRGLGILTSAQYIFDEKNGRASVIFFPGEDSTRGLYYTGWVDSDKVSRFFYDCSCGKGKDDCSPHEVRGLRFSFIWNSCFLEAWETKKAALAASLQAGNQPSSPGKQESVEERLKKLDDYLKRGIISQEEYDKKRAEILSNL